jgi:hypothetical protein
MKKEVFTIIILTFSLLSCHCGKTTTKNIADSAMKKEISFIPGPQAIIYKTIKDYTNLVPVIMNSEKTKIVSYPAPTDVFYQGKLAKPTVLKNGYLLDNRGINENVAFLNYTYEEYSKLPEAPSMKDMLSRITERNPLTELINCGLRSQYTDEVKELNSLIDANFPDCKKAKIKSFSVTLQQ